MNRFFTGKRIAQIAVLSAMSFILMLLRFPIAIIFPSFLELHFSDIPALIGGFAYGPISGCIIVVIKGVLKLIFQGTNTQFVGDLGDLLMGFAFVIPSSIIYKFNRTKKGAVLSLAVGSISSVAVAMVVNRFVLIPIYSKILMPFEVIVRACGVIPGINESNFYAFYIFMAVLPFNALRCIVSSVLTFLLYKRLSGLINRIGGENEKKRGGGAIISKSEADTLKIAQKYAKTLNGGDVVLLKGEMGVGKTVFAKGVALGLGINENVTSPTYAYMNDYDGKLYHYDCYRLTGGAEAEAMGLCDYFYRDGVCLVEWSDNIADVLPKNCKTVEITAVSEKERKIVL